MLPQPIRSKLSLVALATAGAVTLGAPGAHAGVTTDPLHGYCAVGCIDNGTNSPTTQNPPTNFGFTISPGPATGDLIIDILTPTNESHPASFALTGTASGTATLFSATPWTSGQLDTYLGISASPANPIGAFGGPGDTADPTASGFFVYQVDLGTRTLQGASNPNVSPLENITGSTPAGSYIVGFLNEGAGGIIATANSGAIVDGPGTSVPEPASLTLLGTALIGLGALRRRRRSS